MAKIPIEVQKIKSFSFNYQNEEISTTQYLISIKEKGENWNKIYCSDLKELTKFRDEISKIIDSVTTAEKLNINSEKAKILDKHYSEDKLCQNCKYKLTQNCNICIFELQSPLERKLFIEMKNEYIKFQTQYPLNWKGEQISIFGKSYENPINNFKEVLTVVDFYIQKKDLKLCVYTDGHTYHERTEEQAQRDKRIDRKLQELGYKVLRYTGKDVNENTQNIISEIKRWLN